MKPDTSNKLSGKYYFNAAISVNIFLDLQVTIGHMIAKSFISAKARVTRDLRELYRYHQHIYLRSPYLIRY